MRLTLYLLREGADADESSLRSKLDIVPADVNGSQESLAGIYLLHGARRSPAWVGELREVATIPLEQDELETRSIGSVVLIRSAGRVVAATFGSGFHAIDPHLIERGFGLRVTANMIATKGVRGGQTRGVARSSRDQKTLLPVNGEFTDLGVEVDEDWLRQLSGKASDKGFASGVSGADSLTLTIPNFKISQLGSKVDQVMAAWAGKEYEKKFPFLDQIVPIDKSDPLIEDLDALADAQIRAREPAIAFAAPDPFEQLEVDHFELTCQHRRYILSELGTSAVLDVAALLHPDKSPLDGIKVFALDENDDNIDRPYPLKSYLQTEVVLDGENYLLSAGLWFALRRDFVADIDRQVALISDLTSKLSLPGWDAEELKADLSDTTAEGSYNKLVGADRKWAVLDKKLVYFGRNERLEICDLLTEECELLCVKTASDSPTLSHLVAQAVNSAEAWGDKEYQDSLTRGWSEVSALPLPERRDATFVLAIATAKPGTLAESLFFFTKVQIANGARQITRAGFQFALARIEMEVVIAEQKPRTPRTPSFS